MLVFGKRLKELRKDKGLTQQQLGDMVGVTKVSICCYENGTRTPTMQNFLDLVEILNVTPDYLLGRDMAVIMEENEEYKTKISKES